ncbi:MAG TPA: futalosine hydrolase [Bacteroidia bacterium]|nr:futalosine hydrolase [Bacteroidia bacterium]
MKILVVSATYMEIAPLVAKMKFTGEAGPRLRAYEAGRHHVDVLISGVGMTATAYWLGHVFAKEKYEAAFNFGTCGSFDPSFAPGTVVQVISDRISEAGAEDGDKFLSVSELNLLGENEFPYKWGQLVNLHPMQNPSLSSLQQVNGITVNTVHGAEHSIHKVKERYKPQTESMEGAAFAYACLVENIPYAQVRAVSNIVERRNRDAWKMAEAIRNLNEKAAEILDNV